MRNYIHGVAVCAFLIATGESGLASSEPGKKTVSPEARTLLDEAVALPPEFCSDAILRLLEYKLIKQNPDVMEMLEQSFSCADRAQLPYKKLGGRHTDTLQSRRAWDNKLDKLSLQTRAVHLMLELDPGGARKMFDSIVLPDLPHATCKESLVPDVAAYYSALVEVANRGFSPEERREERHIRFIEDRILGVRSIIQLVPMTRALFRIHIDSTVRAALLQELMTNLADLRATDREFGIYEADLVGVLFEADRSNVDFLPVIPLLRSTLIKHYREPRCSDRIKKDRLPESIAQFNELAKRLRASGRDVEYIGAQEVPPRSDAGTFTLDEFWSSRVSEQVRSTLRSLTFRDGRYVSQRDRAGHTWTTWYDEVLDERYRSILRQVDAWQEAEERPPEMYFHTLLSKTRHAGSGSR